MPNSAQDSMPNNSQSDRLGRTQETEFYARQALIALENDACQ
jgi:hypothetical protein